MLLSRPQLLVALSIATLILAFVVASNARAIGNVFATTTCASALPCTGGTNTSTGPGVAGTSTNGRGTAGVTKHNSTALSNGTFGVFGQDSSTRGTYNAGVGGQSVNGTGVSGVSKYNNGVSGASTSETGVYGTSTSYIGVYGTGEFYGVFGYSDTGTGLRGDSNSGRAVYATASSGTAIDASSSGNNNAVYAHNSGTVAALGAANTGTGGSGADVFGAYAGIFARAPAFGGYPLVATDENGNDLFYINGAGDVYYHGTLNHFAQASNGATVKSYTPQSATRAIEDTGTAQLLHGQATVSLDPTFAHAIDVRRPYQVFLTPGGDTRGLYLASKSTSSFVVREVQGGRNTLSFDYHVYATEVGGAGERMGIVHSSFKPSAKVYHRSVPPRTTVPKALKSKP